MFCSKCGSPSPDNARFCASCGQAHIAPTPANTQANPPAYSPAPPPAPQQYGTGAAPAPAGQQPPVYYANPQQSMPPPAQPQPAYYANPQQQFGQPMAQQPVYYQSPGQGWAPGAQGLKPYAVGKNPALAVFLSFLIPGVGQFYCGANSKGAIMLAIFLVSWLMLGIFIGFFGIVGSWIWSMIDAYNVASGKSPLS
ncbi:MAG TPA: zinc-ribbon domain-containing protein [Candidatus Angelobacter sp.]|nr:zinc-ribbon domain-containing protein [Candidatus Angelobacter sp.]